MTDTAVPKYRYYDSSLKQMVYSNTWNKIALFFEWADKYAHNKNLMQFTGIQDKNGNDIYEGDIIQGLHDYGPAGLHLKTAPIFWHNINGYQWNYWNIPSIEIIGNIFQNPNLVNKSSDISDSYIFTKTT